MMEALGNAQIVRGEVVSLAQAVQQLLPEIGSVKVRRDPPGFEHPTHEHDTDEILLIIDGNISFEAHGKTGTCNAGDRLLLPGGTRHSSVAGENGCVYIIAMK